MKILIVLTVIAIQAFAVPENRILHQRWAEFKSVYGKKYEKVEEVLRLNIFKQNSEEIEKHNQLYEEGKVSYKKAVNQFADMTAAEFLNYVTLKNDKKVGGRMIATNHTLFVRPLSVKAPGSMDWRDRGAVTEIKNQGSCGSCWSFSATGALEGQLAIKTGKLISLSEQNLMDCSTPYGNQACNGGWPELAFDYVRDYGITSEEYYPYEGQFDNCRYETEEAVVSSLRGVTDISPGSERDLEYAVATVGPISVAIDVTQNFQFYSSGVFYDNYCDPGSLNHAVLAVGYASGGNNEYWIVKNSWGEGWGDNGYIYMVKNADNNCGIASAASYPMM